MAVNLAFKRAVHCLNQCGDDEYCLLLITIVSLNRSLIVYFLIFNFIPPLDAATFMHGYFFADPIHSFHRYTLCPGKKRPRYFQLQLSHSLVDFYNFYTVGNRNEHSTITCNLLT